jgi:hypothetical protein
VEAWDGWSAERWVLVLVVVLYAGIWIQVTLMHWGGGFSARAMWAPVVEGPLIVAAVAVAILIRQEPWGWLAVVLLAFGVLGGLYGTYRHVRGVRSQIGGFSLRNFISGPPPMLPVAFSLLGVLGIVALLVSGTEG